MKPILTACAVALACATPAAAKGPDLNPEIMEKIKVEAGEELFRHECRRCHATDPVDPSYGPPLENVVGRGAGTYPDYDYSIALSASGIVWTDAAIRAWMEDNSGFMPGTKMRHVGITDRTIQDFILAYLHSISKQDNSAISEDLTK
ncbi:cytochrome c family protein [Rhodovulum sp. P5]|uniref:c-type cytochrome n=1 Tax=Rhodovulum sp. P5 TaxID=1564506 RepID=UPI0009D92142|nr:c-type cytochrome [Rhodovulum sp. P5]